MHPSDAMPDALPEALEAGTPNTAAYFGWLAGIEWVLERGIEALHAHELEVLDAVLAGIQGVEGLRAVHAKDPRVAVASLYFDELEAHEAAMALEGDEVIMRAGYHCAPYAHASLGDPSASLRVSPGALQSKADAELLVKALRGLCA